MKIAMSGSTSPPVNATTPAGRGSAPSSSTNRAAPSTAAAPTVPVHGGKESKRRSRREKKRDAGAAYLPRRLFGITRGGIASSASPQAGFGVPDSPRITAGAGVLDPIIEGDEGGSVTPSMYARVVGWSNFGSTRTLKGIKNSDVLHRRRIPSFLSPYVRTASLVWGLTCILTAIAHSRSFPWEVEAAWCVTCVVSFTNEVLGNQLLQVAAAAGMRN